MKTKYVILANASSCLTEFKHRLNALDAFNELKKHLNALGLGPESTTLVSDPASCKKMVEIVEYYMEDYFKADYSKLDNRKTIMPFNLGNEILNELELTPLVFAVHHFDKTAEILQEIGVKNFEKELKKEQFVVVDMTAEKIIFLSRAFS